MLLLANDVDRLQVAAHLLLLLLVPVDENVAHLVLAVIRAHLEGGEGLLATVMHYEILLVHPRDVDDVAPLLRRQLLQVRADLLVFAALSLARLAPHHSC